MIAIWMLYSLITGAMFAAIAWLLERIARSWRLPTRGIWLGAMGLAVALSAIALIPGTNASPAGASPPRVAIVVAQENGRTVKRAIVRPDGPFAEIRSRARKAGAAIAAQISAASNRLAPWNTALVVAWLVLTVCLAGIVAHAVRDGRRMKRGLDAREIDGTPVLMTESIGPAHPDVSTYGRLLLLTCQRTMRAPWASLPMFTVVVPLQPRASQLAQRIAIMTSRGRARSGVATVALLAGTAAAAAIVLIIPAPRPMPPAAVNVVAAPPPTVMTDTVPDDPRFAIVHMTRLGLFNVPTDFERNEILGEILIYADGPARVSTGLDPLMLLTGTLHLKRLPRINADVTESNVYIELIGPGEMSIEGRGTGPAVYFGARGTRIMLRKGGMGIGTPR
jgi:hypothetical protein